MRKPSPLTVPAKRCEKAKGEKSGLVRSQATLAANASGQPPNLTASVAGATRPPRESSARRNQTCGAATDDSAASLDAGRVSGCHVPSFQPGLAGLGARRWRQRRNQ